MGPARYAFRIAPRVKTIFHFFIRQFGFHYLNQFNRPDQCYFDRFPPRFSEILVVRSAKVPLHAASSTSFQALATGDIRVYSAAAEGRALGTVHPKLRHLPSEGSVQPCADKQDVGPGCAGPTVSHPLSLGLLKQR